MAFQSIGSFGFGMGRVPGFGFGGPSLGGGGFQGSPVGGNPQAAQIYQIAQMLQGVLGALQQLRSGFQGIAGPGNPGGGLNPGFGGGGGGLNPGFGGGQNLPLFGTPQRGVDPRQFLIGSPLVVGAPATPVSGGGLYGGAPVGPGQQTGGVSAPGIPSPSDPRDGASYLQAQVAGGALNGQTTVRQSDGIPGTRFAQVQPPELWHANVARQYAYQFAAYASGNDPLSAQGLQAGEQALKRMSPESQLFMQVASVFKGNLLNGPGLYDNPGLKQLLTSVGRGDLASGKGVGQTDVQTIGSVAAAINDGSLSLQQVIQSGTIDNLDRYGQIINYVQTGQFANALTQYDNIPL